MGVDAVVVVAIPGELLSKEALRELSAKLCISLGAKNFFLDPVEGEGAFTVAWPEDYKMVPEPEGQLYDIHVWSRFYAPGYERGDCLFLCALGEWLEANIPGAQVYYGGDCDNVLSRFDEAARKKLKEHLYSQEGRAYFGSGDAGFSLREGTLVPPTSDCKLCVKDYKPSRNGCGRIGPNEFGSFGCAVCGRNFTTRDSGTTWKIEDKN